MMMMDAFFDHFHIGAGGPDAVSFGNVVQAILVDVAGDDVRFLYLAGLDQSADQDFAHISCANDSDDFSTQHSILLLMVPQVRRAPLSVSGPDIQPSSFIYSPSTLAYHRRNIIHLRHSIRKIPNRVIETVYNLLGAFPPVSPDEFKERSMPKGF